MNPEFLKKLSEASTDYEKAFLMAEFSTSENSSIWKLVQALAIPHSFDRQLIEYLGKKTNIEINEELFDALHKLTYVEPFGNNEWTIHDLTRKGILNHLNKNQNYNLREKAEILSNYFDQKLDEKSIIESIYLKLIIDLKFGTRKLKQRSRDFRGKKNFNAAHSLFDIANELIEIGVIEDRKLPYELEKQEYYTITEKLDSWNITDPVQKEANFKEALSKLNYQNSLDFQEISKDRKEFKDKVDDIKLETLEKNLKNALDHEGKIIWLIELSVFHGIKEEFEQSKKYINDALEISPQNIDVLIAKSKLNIVTKDFSNAEVLLKKLEVTESKNETFLDAKYWFFNHQNKHELSIIPLNEAIQIDKTAWRLFQRGMTYQKMGEYKKAITDFNKAIKLDGSDAGNFGQRGMVYQKMGEYKKAIKDFNKAIKLDGSDAWDFGQRGMAYKKTGQYRKAIADFSKAEDLDGLASGGFAQRGVCFGMLKNYEKAIADFSKAIELDDSDAWNFGQRGLTYQKKDEYKKAIKDFSKAIELNDSYEWSYGQRGLTYQIMGEYEKAIADFSKAIELDSSDDWNFSQRGLTYQKTGEHEKAIKDFSKAIELNGSDPWDFSQRGLTYQKMGEHDKAIADFDKIINIDGYNSWGLGRRGFSYERIGEYKKAIADLDKAEELDNLISSGFALRGVCYRNLKKYTKALVDFDKAIQMDESAWKLGQRGLLYRKMREYNKALADFNKAIQMDESAWNLSQRGMIYEKIGKYNKTIVDLSKAIELDDSYEWSFQRGFTYQKMGELDKALADFERIIQLSDIKVIGFIASSYIYQKTGKYNKSISKLNKAIELDDSIDTIYSLRGLTYQKMGEYEKALADFDLAIKMEEFPDFIMLKKAVLMLALGRPTESIKLLKDALEINFNSTRDKVDMLTNEFQYHLILENLDESKRIFSKLLLDCKLLKGEIDELKEELDEILFFIPDHKLVNEYKRKLLNFQK